jgi:hypothetical protein
MEIQGVVSKKKPADRDEQASFRAADSLSLKLTNAALPAE